MIEVSAVNTGHPIVLDMIAGLASFIGSECNEFNCGSNCSDCGRHTDEYVDLVNEIYQSAATAILDDNRDQWEVLAEVVEQLKAIEHKELYVANIQ